MLIGVEKLDSDKIMTDDKALQFFRYMVKGLEIIHKMKIAHRNINPYTIWIDGNKAIFDGFMLERIYNREHEDNNQPVNNYRLPSVTKENFSRLNLKKSELPKTKEEEKKRKEEEEEELTRQQISDFHSLGLVLYFMASKASSSLGRHPPKVNREFIPKGDQFYKNVKNDEIRKTLEIVLSLTYSEDFDLANLVKKLQVEPWKDEGNFFSETK